MQTLIPGAASMDDDELLAVEVQQFLQHVHDIADLIAARMSEMPPHEAEAFLERELSRLAVSAKQIEGSSTIPGVAARVGFKVSAVIRARVEELRRRL